MLFKKNAKKFFKHAVYAMFIFKLFLVVVKIISHSTKHFHELNKLHMEVLLALGHFVYNRHLGVGKTPQQLLVREDLVTDESHSK